jgi:hypothetical protein
MHEDMDISCRAAVAVQEISHPVMKQWLLSELLATAQSPANPRHEKASALLFILAPRLVGYPQVPPTPPSSMN